MHHRHRTHRIVSKRFVPPALVWLVVMAWAGGSLAASPGAASAQDPPEAIEPPAEIDTQHLADRIAELTTQKEEAELPPEVAQELGLLEETQQFLADAILAMASADKFAAEARSASEQSAQIDEFLEAPAENFLEEIDASLPLDELTPKLAAARVRLESERDLRAAVDTDQASRDTRRGEIPAERAQSTQRLDALSAELAAGSPPETPEAIATATRWRALAEQYEHRATLRALDEELRDYDTRQPLLEKRRTYRDRWVSLETRNVTALQEAAGAKQVELAAAAEREAAREAGQQQPDEANANPLVKSILEKSQEYTAANTRILELNATDTVTKANAEARLEEWKNEFERSAVRVKRAGLTNAIGQHLRNHRSRLLDVNELQQQMDVRDRQMGALVNDAEDWTLLLKALADVDDAVEREFSEYADSLPDDETERDDIRLAARTALLRQREYLTTLNASTNDYLDNTLLELQNTQRELHDLLVEYTDFINERILWIQSAEVLQLDDLRASRDAVLWLFDDDEWASVGTDIWNDVDANPLLYGLCVSVLAGLLLSQLFLRRGLKSIAARTKRYTSDRFSLTASGLAVTVLMAAAIPAPMAFLAWRLSIATIGDALGTGLSVGLFQATELLFAAELIRKLCRRGGVGETQFRWKQATLAGIRRHLRWLIPIVVPLTFVAGVTSMNDNHHDSLGRIAFMAEMIVFALFLQRMFRPSGGIVRTILVQHPGGWLDRLQYVWYPLLVLGPLATAVVAGLGYFYSAFQLDQRILDTSWLLLLVCVGRAVMLRGLFIAQRRLNIEQRKKKLAAQAESASSKVSTATPAATEGSQAGQEPAAEQMHPVTEPEEIDIAAVSAQTRKLLNATVVFTVLIGLAVVWIDMLPALGFIQDVPLWTLDSGTPPTVPADGVDAESAASLLAPGESVITLGHFVNSFLILLITALVSKDIPGLLEIVMLQRLPISPSARYAITTIARYVLIIIGIVLAFGAIGVGWSQVQWLAAAITVGLGFGLQEIFANLVSGLIILFERPVRVGDTVTVGGITGKVASLRIRATTIVDWDRKELIIPNKEFITGQIINWTLSDPILRIVVPVGIAYGSDTKLAEKILLQVASDEPSVLDEPASSVVFSEFGDSSLNFNLRVFISNIDNLFTVRHRLHNAIDQAFRKAEIVIAFPQQDVYLHQAPEK